MPNSPPKCHVKHNTVNKVMVLELGRKGIDRTSWWDPHTFQVRSSPNVAGLLKVQLEWSQNKWMVKHISTLNIQG